MIKELVSKLTASSELLSSFHAAWAETCIAAVGNIDTAKMSAYNDDDFWPEEGSWMSQYRPYRVKDGILSIPVSGVLISEFNYTIGGFITGYTYLTRAMERGLEDPEVRGIALMVNSPGGECSGNFDLVDKIYAGRSVKPIRAFAEHAYSGGYSIASAADEITVTRTGGVGSIGVVAWHFSYEEFLKEQGIKATPIYAGKHKIDGNAYQDLPESVKNRMQARIDSLNTMFVETVARNRGMTDEAVRATEALTFSAAEAIENGLADAVGSFEDSVSAFAKELSTSGGMFMSKDNVQENAQAVTEAAVATAKAEGVKEGVTSERARIKTICECDEAKTRVASAFNLAVNTDMTADQAKSLLATLPEDVKVVAPVATETVGADNAFVTAMKTGNPEITAGGEGGGEQTPVQSILSDYHAAVGGKPKK